MTDNIESQGRILVVDDEPSSRQGLEKLLRRNSFRVQSEADGEAALRAAAEFTPDVVVTDLRATELLPPTTTICGAGRPSARHGQGGRGSSPRAPQRDGDQRADDGGEEAPRRGERALLDDQGGEERDQNGEADGPGQR